MIKLIKILLKKNLQIDVEKNVIGWTSTAKS